MSLATSPIPTPQLDTVLKEMAVWRENKVIHKQTAIPDELWRKILSLGNYHGATKIRSLFGISSKQYESKQQQIAGTISQPNTTHVEFCQVAATPPQPAYKPEAIPTINANTVTVVEFCRHDGNIMKIHTTTQHFKTIIQSFFEGDQHAAN